MRRPRVGVPGEGRAHWEPISAPIRKRKRASAQVFHVCVRQTPSRCKHQIGCGNARAHAPYNQSFGPTSHILRLTVNKASYSSHKSMFQCCEVPLHRCSHRPCFGDHDRRPGTPCASRGVVLEDISKNGYKGSTRNNKVDNYAIERVGHQGADQYNLRALRGPTGPEGVKACCCGDIASTC